MTFPNKEKAPVPLTSDSETSHPTLEQYKGAVGELTETTKTRNEALSAYRNASLEVDTRYREIVEMRNVMLKNILVEKGLDFCTFHSSHHPEIKKKKDPTLEDLGIYPKDKLKIYFSYYGSDLIQISLECPHCISIHPRDVGENATSGVLTTKVALQNERYIQASDQKDVTDDVSDLYNRALDNDDERIFKLFGIPRLPKYPSEPYGD